MILDGFYYRLKSVIPRRVQISLRKQIASQRRRSSSNVWPIDKEAGNGPPEWKGWPDGKKFAVVLTHDVESRRGVTQVKKIIALEKALGFKSSFNFVAEDYSVAPELLEYLRREGMEIGIHGLSHKGNIFHPEKRFPKKAVRINEYIAKWGIKGFRAPSMYHNFKCISALDLLYDSSTFDTDPFEPQPDGVGTIFPFRVWDPKRKKEFVELPYTLPQDHTLFIILEEKGIDIWKEKVDWIAEQGGMALLITHPDYMNFDNKETSQLKYPVKYYEDFLQYIRDNYQGKFWNVLPKDVAYFWKENCYNVKPVGGNKKICMVTYSFYETDNRVMRYAESLARRGDEVEVISLKKPGQSKKDKIRGVNVFRIQERVKDEKGKLSYLIRMVRFLFISSLKLAQNYLLKKYDLIHVHSVPDFEVFAALVPKIMGAKIILDIHDILPEFYSSKFGDKGSGMVGKLLRLIEKVSCSFADHVIISNHLWKGVLVSRSVGEKKCSVILNYPDRNIFHSSETRNPGEKITVIYPGTLNWHQGVDVAIKGFEKVVKEVENAEFHIYGSGPAKADLMKLVKNLNLGEKVIFKEVVPIDQIADIMSRADIGIVPKRNDEFGGTAFSTKILEFMILGVPVIVSDTQIDRYYFKDSIVKFFKAGDENDLARSMLFLIRNKKLSDCLAENASKFVADYSWEERKDEYLNLVDGITNSVPDE